MPKGKYRQKLLNFANVWKSYLAKLRKNWKVLHGAAT